MNVVNAKVEGISKTTHALTQETDKKKCVPSFPKMPSHVPLTNIVRVKPQPLKPAHHFSNDARK